MTIRSRGLVGGASALAMALGAGQAMAQPANNACANAQVLTLTSNGSVSVLGENIGATPDLTSGNCGNSNASPDVWYTVTVPSTNGNGTITFSTCAPETDYPTVLTIRTGAACPGGVINGVNCNDVDLGCGRSRLSLQTSAGTVYRIRVGGIGGATGHFRLTVSHTTTPSPTLGPDVITNVLTDVARWGTSTNGQITAYSVGTDSCNRGDYPVLWIDNNNYGNDYNVTMHPVIGQNMYRLKNYGGYQRFEHLGQSWLKHGFVSTNSGGCGGCSPNSTRIWRYSTQTYQSIGGDALGLNCSDTYGSSLNGSQSGLGAKNIVNATLGTSPFVRGNGTGDSTTRMRLQVATSAVSAQPAGTRFYVDAQYVTADDAQFVRPGTAVAINALNNSSWREVNAATINSSPGFTGATVQQQPGIFAWRVADPQVTLVSADHDDTPNPGTGFRAPNGQPQNPVGTTTVRARYWVAAKVTEIAVGQFRYEYAIYNHNSDRAAGTFSVAYADSLPDPSGFAFHAPQYHSGEPWSNAAWTMTKANGALSFGTQSFAANPNASALRWGTLYNVGFTSDRPPTTGTATIGLFKPGASPEAPSSVLVSNLPVPSLPPPCAADFDGDGLRTPDDLSSYITCYFTQIAAPGACEEADFDGSGSVNPDDLADFITVFFTVNC